MGAISSRRLVGSTQFEKLIPAKLDDRTEKKLLKIYMTNGLISRLMSVLSL